MKYFDSQNQGVLFTETVVNIGWQRHTVIEAIPVSRDVQDDAVAYFREALTSAAEEWSTHKKVIDTRKRGFRNSLVKQLPYFHVWIGLDGGLGHVIEGDFQVDFVRVWISVYR